MSDEPVVWLVFDADYDVTYFKGCFATEQEARAAIAALPPITRALLEVAAVPFGRLDL